MHGLLFGGFRSVSRHQGRYDQSQNRRNEEVMGIHTIPDYYRSAGCHRIATHLRKQDWDIECLDYMWAFSTQELIQYVDERITKATVFLGVSIIFDAPKESIPSCIKMIEHVRKKYPWVRIIIGGTRIFTVTAIPDADYYISGNGEYAIDAVLKYEMGKGPEPEITEVLENGGKIIDAYTKYPCYPKRDASISYEERDFIQPYETLNIEFGRGCRFKCKYCSFPLIGLKGNMMRDGDSLREELRENYERWGVHSYYITDDTVNDTKEKMQMIGEVVNSLSFQPQFNGYARADLLIRHGVETWNHMIDAGFTSHSYGVESLNHESAKAMGKGMPIAEMKEGLLAVEEHFVANSPYYYAGSLTMIAGLPFETFESLESTKNWLNTYWSNHNISYLPLLLPKLNNDDVDKLDGDKDNVVSDFWNYGYTVNKNVEYNIMTSKQQFAKRNAEKHRESSVRYESSGFELWTHPSDEYDFLDMAEWIKDFTTERMNNGFNPRYCFLSNEAWIREFDNKSNLKNYFKADAPEADRSYLYDLVKTYKENKLSLNTHS